MNIPDHTKIDARRIEIAAEMARLKKESEDLDIAERVFNQLYGPPQITSLADARLGRPRPEGGPTTFEMVELSLLGAEKEGKDGLSISELVDEIRKRYWPGLVGQQVTPLIYQFASKGRIHKTPSGKFKRIKTNEKGPES